MLNRKPVNPDDKTPVLFGANDFDALTESARNAPRRRTNRDFHDSPSHPAQRFLNAMEPDSYVRPHRHTQALKQETFVVLRGAFGLVLFDDTGGVTRTAVLRAGGERVGAHLPSGVFHALVALEPGSVFFEVKAGPYDARTDKEWGSWAPAEGGPDANTYLERLRSLFA
ncbi:MAG: mannose-6-phosphate isomerase [Betaproteobacteria bacterium]|nr:mannose-6-phosphate isomerase [Betaproteobacteria bacterium]